MLWPSDIFPPEGWKEHVRVLPLVKDRAVIPPAAPVAATTVAASVLSAVNPHWWIHGQAERTQLPLVAQTPKVACATSCGSNEPRELHAICN